MAASPTLAGSRAGAGWGRCGLFCSQRVTPGAGPSLRVPTAPRPAGGARGAAHVAAVGAFSPLRVPPLPLIWAALCLPRPKAPVGAVSVPTAGHLPPGRGATGARTEGAGGGR